jgi:hypothetical protein
MSFEFFFLKSVRAKRLKDFHGCVNDNPNITSKIDVLFNNLSKLIFFEEKSLSIIQKYYMLTRPCHSIHI